MNKNKRLHRFFRWSLSLFLVLTLSSGKDAWGQANDITGQGLQIGLKFTWSDQFLWNKAAEIRFVQPNVQWTLGYQYFNAFSPYEESMEGIYGEADFLSINFTDDLRLGFPLRLYAGSSPFRYPFTVFMSVGSNLRYRIHERWEIGLESGYIGYGRGFSQEYDYISAYAKNFTNMLYKFRSTSSFQLFSKRSLGKNYILGKACMMGSEFRFITLFN